MGDQSCSDDYDCSYNSACQGWCAWNSQKGCSTACREEVPRPKPPPQQGMNNIIPYIPQNLLTSISLVYVIRRNYHQLFCGQRVKLHRQTNSQCTKR